jgi:DNA processing protein
MSAESSSRRSGTGTLTAPSPWPVWPDGFDATPADRRALLVLSALRGATPRALIPIANRVGSASGVLAEIAAGRVGSENDAAFARSLDPAEIGAAARRCGARFVTWGSPDYPAQLRHIHDPPAALYVQGRETSGSEVLVAVVGARRCTSLGREIASAIGHGLGAAGATVVSGAARGIDAAAHEGALEAGGATLAVLGSGLDVDYPVGGRRLVERIRAAGTLVAEYAPGTPPHPWHFPARNRIVAGLCCATVVVEGAVGSGSMITAEHAMEFGRDVYAVPGAVTNPLSAVPMQLIREGATMIRGAEDLVNDLGLDSALEHPVAPREVPSEAERKVLDRLAGPTLPDVVASALSVGVPEVVGTLMRLELRGLVRSVGGRYEATLAGTRAGRRTRGQTD